MCYARIRKVFIRVDALVQSIAAGETTVRWLNAHSTAKYDNGEIVASVIKISKNQKNANDNCSDDKATE